MDDVRCEHEQMNSALQQLKACGAINIAVEHDLHRPNRVFFDFGARSVTHCVGETPLEAIENALKWIERLNDVQIESGSTDWQSCESCDSFDSCESGGGHFE